MGQNILYGGINGSSENVEHSIKMEGNLVSNIEGGTQTERVWEQGAEENIWTEEGWSDGRLEETA
jgi:hypothetical protein